MARTDPQTNIRLPPDLKDRIAVAAKENNRTLGSEIVARLEETFDGRPKWMGPNADPAIRAAVREALSVYVETTEKSNQSVANVSEQINVLSRAYERLERENEALRSDYADTHQASYLAKFVESIRGILPLKRDEDVTILTHLLEEAERKATLPLRVKMGQDAVLQTRKTERLAAQGKRSKLKHWERDEPA